MADQVKFINKLKDKHVLIIGGSSGIGYGVAEGVLENGGRVTLSSSSASKVENAVQRLKKAYPSANDRVAGYAASMGDESTMENEIKGLFEKTGKLDHFVYTAGDALATTPIQEATLAGIKKAGMVRFFAPILCAKYAPNYMDKSPASSITLTTGSVSEHPYPGWGVMNGFATGLQGTTRGLALDLKPIRVNLISPGAVETELWDSFPEDKRKEALKSFGAKMTTGTIGLVEDVAEAYLYCMRDKNVSGSMISTNGGQLLL